MGVGVWEFLNPALIQVQENSEKVLRLKQGKVSDFLQLNFNSPTLRFLPALVLTGAFFYGAYEFGKDEKHLFSPKHQEEIWFKKTLGMSTILQLLYLAAEIHHQIKDNQGNVALNAAFEEETPHFPVLIGDFIFGKLLEKLCDIDYTERVAELAQIICCMNEGAIQRKLYREKNESDREALVAIIDKEFGRLFFEAGEVGVLLGGGEKEDAQIFGRFAACLGLMLGSVERKDNLLVLDYAYQEALKALALLPEGWLQNVAQQFLNEVQAECSLEKLAV